MRAREGSWSFGWRRMRWWVEVLEVWEMQNLSREKTLWVAQKLTTNSAAKHQAVAPNSSPTRNQSMRPSPPHYL